MNCETKRVNNAPADDTPTPKRQCVRAILSFKNRRPIDVDTMITPDKLPHTDVFEIFEHIEHLTEQQYIERLFYVGGLVQPKITSTLNTAIVYNIMRLLTKYFETFGCANRIMNCRGFVPTLSRQLAYDYPIHGGHAFRELGGTYSDDFNREHFAPTLAKCRDLFFKLNVEYIAHIADARALLAAGVGNSKPTINV